MPLHVDEGKQTSPFMIHNGGLKRSKCVYSLSKSQSTPARPIVAIGMGCPWQQCGIKGHVVSGQHIKLIGWLGEIEVIDPFKHRRGP